MRTFIIMLALIANMASFAQQDTAWAIHEPVAFDSLAMGKCLETWDNVKPYMSADTVDKYCPSLVKKYGLDQTCLLVMALFSNEDNGSVTDTTDHGHGFGNIHKPFMYKEYMTKAKKMPGFQPYKYEDLDDPMNIRFTLLTLNWQFSPLNKTKFKNDAERWMAWNVGFGGLSDPNKKDRRESYFARLELYLEIHSELAESYAQAF